MSEFKALMALRTAFGPDSLLWKRSSPSDLCYDWLEFKSQEPGRPFTIFVRLLMRYEVAENPDPQERTLLCQRIEAFLRKCDANGITGCPWKVRRRGPLRRTSSISLRSRFPKRPCTYQARFPLQLYS